MRNVVEPALLAYRGVLIERPCAWCDATSIHFDGLCQDGPCSVCGVPRREGGWASHPRNADGTWHVFPDSEQHDWTPHSYLPADIDLDSPAFEAIVDVARTLGMPERYTSDLFRDYQSIVANPGARFVWIVRQWGTHYITPVISGAVTYLRDNEPTAQVFWWNGFTLEPINWDTAAVLLVVPSWTQVTA